MRWAIPLLCLVASGADLQTFTLPEVFNVTYRTQSVEFPYAGAYCPPSSCRLIGPAASEVPWQQLSNGSILVRTGLPALTTYTWTLQDGAATTAAAPTNPVVTTSATDYIEVSNGLAGFRIRKESANGSPYSKSPLMGVRLSNGTWISIDDTMTLSNTSVSSYRVSVMEQGALRTQVRVQYATTRTVKYSAYGVDLVPVGPHSWTATFTLDAGSKAWLYEDYLDEYMLGGISIPLYAAFPAAPDRYRWRGHTSPSTDCGTRLSGAAYDQASSAYQAVATLTYPQPTCNYIQSGEYSIWQTSSMNRGGGVEWITYNEAEASTAPTFGYFVARLSQSYGGPMGGNFAYESTAAPALRVLLPNIYRAADGRQPTYYKRSFGIYTGTKAELGDDSTVPEISQYRNDMGGINLNKIARADLTAIGNTSLGWPYTADATITTLRSNVRDGTAVCGSSACVYTPIYNSMSSETRTILAMWRTATEAAVETALADARSSTYGIRPAMEAYANSAAGISSLNYAYWHLSASAQKKAAICWAIIQDDVATAAQKLEAKQILVAIAQILSDDDFVPYRNAGAGDSWGTANMPVQYSQGRNNIFLLANGLHPTFGASTTAEARSGIVPNLNLAASEYGSGKDSTHYQGTFLTNSAHAFLQLLKQGVEDIAQHERWKLNGMWEISALTPPEPRFGNVRKAVSNGDGNTSAHERLGLLGTFYATEDATAAGKFMWGWRSQNTATYISHDEFYTPTILSIDDSIESVDPALGSQYFPGYWSVFRAGWGGNNELATWFHHGDYYSDHRHSDDGQVTLYAHKAPLSVDWNPNLYSPQVPGGYMHNVVTLASDLAADWDADNPVLSGGSVFTTQSEDAGASFTKSAFGAATFAKTGLTWTRNCRMMAYQVASPYLWCKDSFGGASAEAAKVLTWNNMAVSPVTTPEGSYATTARNNVNNNGVLPSVGTVNTLGSGWQKFSFTGATWAAHATGGIDWDLWLTAPGASWFIGNWSHDRHSTREMAEYNTANSASFVERQQILRANHTGTFYSLFGPYRKTETPTRTLSAESCGTQIVEGSNTLCFTDSHAQWTDGTTSVLSLYDSTEKAYGGVTASGGAQEIIVGESSIVWTFGDVAPGARVLTVPSGWYPDKVLAKSGQTFTAYHPGGVNPVMTVVTFSQTPVTLTTRALSFPGYSGATAVRVSIDGEYLAQGACSSGCSVSIAVSPGSHTLKWQYVDNAGAAVGPESSAVTIE